MPTVDDIDPEADETFTLEISDVVNAVPGDGIGLGTILDNDPVTGLPELSIADTIVDEGSTARVMITLSQPFAQDVSFQILTVDESATANSDYSPKNGNRIIAAGNTETIIWIPIAEDTDVEGDETFRLEISNAVNAIITDPDGQITISDNDTGTGLPLLSITATSDFEGRFARFNLSLSEPSAQPVSFMFATVPGSAEDPADYIGNSGMRSFNPGEVEKTIWITTVDDLLVEADENFSMQISNVTNATAANSSATATIVNNDTAAGDPELIIADTSVVEGTLARVIVTLSQAASRDVVFTLTTVDQTATANLDYTPKSGTRVIDAGEIEKIIWIPITDDTLVEGTETFRLEISNAINAVISNADSIITIMDN